MYCTYRHTCIHFQKRRSVDYARYEGGAGPQDAGVNEKKTANAAPTFRPQSMFFDGDTSSRGKAEGGLGCSRSQRHDGNSTRLSNLNLAERATKEHRNCPGQRGGGGNDLQFSTVLRGSLHRQGALSAPRTRNKRSVGDQTVTRQLWAEQVLMGFMRCIIHVTG